MTELRSKGCAIREEAGQLVIVTPALERRVRLRTTARTVSIADRATGTEFVAGPCKEFSVALRGRRTRLHAGHFDFWDLRAQKAGKCLRATIELRGKASSLAAGMPAALSYIVMPGCELMWKEVAISAPGETAGAVERLAVEDLDLVGQPGRSQVDFGIGDHSGTFLARAERALAVVQGRVGLGFALEGPEGGGSFFEIGEGLLRAGVYGGAELRGRVVAGALRGDGREMERQLAELATRWGR